MGLGRFSYGGNGLGNRVHVVKATTLRTISKPNYDSSAYFYDASPVMDLGMSERTNQRREAFRAWVAEQGGVSAVARKTGLTGSTLYSYLDKKKPTNALSVETIESITSAFGVPVETLFGQTSERRQVPVAYYVGAGSEVHAYAESQGPFDYVDAPADAGPNTVAGKIDGVSLGRMLDRAVVFWDDVHSPVTPDQHGRLCVCELHDGRVLVKEIQPARTPGLYHLFSETEQPILDVPLVWAAVVTNIRPR